MKVVIASPNVTHFEYATAALKAGKHGEYSYSKRCTAVPAARSIDCLLASFRTKDLCPKRHAESIVMVEKPITRSAAEAQQLVDLAKSVGRILTVYQNRRWDSDFLTVLKLLEEGKVRLRPF